MPTTRPPMSLAQAETLARPGNYGRVATALIREVDRLRNSLRLAADLVDENQFGGTVDVEELRQAIGHYPDA